MIDKVNLKQLDGDAWALRLLEEIHTLWLVCLNLRAKFHYQPELYSSLVTLGSERLAELKSKGLTINLVMQKSLIEVASIYDRQDIATKVTELGVQSKNNSLAIHRTFSVAIAYKQQLKAG